ncbi:hypothetical protein GCM10010517_18040 [Streptosporangium fragile]|uniref:Uncharacterized protein n=1 Tax=Streptosporangium fragile TaxID=46186 RepID=A0ABN3VUA9_9ACTN
MPPRRRTAAGFPEPLPKGAPSGVPGRPAESGPWAAFRIPVGFSGRSVEVCGSALPLPVRGRGAGEVARSPDPGGRARARPAAPPRVSRPVLPPVFGGSFPG